MFILWRRLVAWLRTLLLSWVTKTPIDWQKKIDEALQIAIDANKKINDNKPVTPNYDLIGPLPKKFRLLNWFRRKK